jgi:cytolethal distending toxin subunit B
MHKTINKTSAWLFSIFLATASLPTLAGVQDHTPMTWNMQGSTANGNNKWTDAIRHFTQNHDVISLQEAGPEAVVAALSSAHHRAHYSFHHNNQNYNLNVYEWNVGTSSRPIMRYIYFMRTDFSIGNRVNLAIVTREFGHPHFIPPQPDDFGNPLNSRPAFGVQLADGTVFYTMHALSFHPHNDANNLIHAMNDRHLIDGRSWAVMGDFNQHPNLTQAAPVGLRMFYPIGATHQGGGLLDYMVARINGNPIPWGGRRLSRGNSDHRPVEFGLGGGAADIPEVSATSRPAKRPLLISTEYDGNHYCTGYDAYGRSIRRAVDFSESPENSRLTIVSDRNQNTLLLSESMDGRLYKTRVDEECNMTTATLLDQAVSAPSPAEEPVLEDVTTAHSQNGNLLAIGADASGRLYYSAENDSSVFSTWKTPEDFIDKVRHRPALMLGADHRLQLYTTGSDGQLILNAQRSDGTWATMPHANTGERPTHVNRIVSGIAFDGNLHVFALDRAGQLYRQYQVPSGERSAWARLNDEPIDGFDGTYPFQTIEVIAGQGRMHLFGIDFLGRVWRNTLTSGVAGKDLWTGWTILNVSLPAYGLDVGFGAEGIEVSVATEDGSLFRMIETPDDYSDTYHFFPEQVCHNRCLRTNHYVSSANPGTRLTITTNHQATNAVRVVLADPEGIPVAGVAVGFFITSGNANLANAVGVTDSAGAFSTSVTRTDAVAATIIARFDNEGDGVPESPITNGGSAALSFPLPPLVPPSNLRKVGSGCCHTYGNFAWTPTPFSDGYEIYMDGFLGGGCTSDHRAIVEGQVGSGRVQAFGLCLGSKYNVKIRARRNGQWSAWSPSIRITL